MPRSFRVPARLGQSLLRRRQVQLQLELLETRTLPSAYPLSPVETRHAYGFDQISGDGTGQTIGIVDAYDDPNIFKDVDTFDKQYSWSAGGVSLYNQFGASSSFLTKATPGGHTRANVGWAQEISLDVEWAHAIAPAAHILLVEARTNSLTDLLSAVDYATNHGATVVSMSWGSGEFSGETGYDFHFSHTGVTYVASAGDTGSVTEWPAVSPNVVGVGGTALNVDTSGNYLSETGWSASGGGVSSVESQPAYQQGKVPQSTTSRTSPDIGYDADPNTGFAVYDSYFAGGWGQYGGTSAGAPQIAALFAIANQGRSAGNLSSASALNSLYSLINNNTIDTTRLNDVSNGSSGTYSALPGYDLVTGLGTPKAAALITFLRGTSGNAIRNPGGGSTVGAGGGGNLNPHAPGTGETVIIVVSIQSPTLAQPGIPVQSPTIAVSSPSITASATNFVPPVLVGSSSSVRIESGGGDNAPLSSDDDMNSQPDLPSFLNNVQGENSTSAATPRAQDSQSGNVPLRLWQEATSACFAKATEQSDTVVQNSTVWTPPEAASPAGDGFDPAAAAASLAVAFGAYWRGQTDERDSRRSTRLPA